MRLNVYCLAMLLMTGSMNAFAQPEPLKLYLPKDIEVQEPPKPSKEEFLFTLVLADEKEILYYSGYYKKNKAAIKTGYGEVRKIIQKKKKAFGDSLLVVIKPSGGASYKNVVDILDEMTINDIKRYILIDITKEEETAWGLKPYEVTPADAPKIFIPGAVNSKPDYSQKDILLITIDGKGAIEYGFGKGLDQQRTKLSTNDTARFSTIIEELITGKLGFEVFVKGENDAPFGSFKMVIEALKKNNLFKFKMVTDQD
jgi:biopolymer transport protein ExbD